MSSWWRKLWGVSSEGPGLHPMAAVDTQDSICRVQEQRGQALLLPLAQ